MKYYFPYGTHSALTLEIPEQTSCYFPHSFRHSVPLKKISELLSRRLNSPLKYPSLRTCLMEGDRLVIPVAPGIPHVETILAGILEHLFSENSLHTDPSDPLHKHTHHYFRGKIFILRSSEDVNHTGISDEEFRQKIFKKLPKNILEIINSTFHVPKNDFSDHACHDSACKAHGCSCTSDSDILENSENTALLTVQTHDPTQKEQLALLGVRENDEPFIINRLLFDADFILPVAEFFPQKRRGYYGSAAALYPLFSDKNTQERFHNRKNTAFADELHEVIRLLGVTLTLQILPNIPVFSTSLLQKKKKNTDSRIADIMVGSLESIWKTGTFRYHQLWRAPAFPKAQIVLASITGGTETQTWENITHALLNAAKYAEEDALIFLACDISSPAGPAIQAYSRIQDPNMTIKFLQKKNFPDTILAKKLIPLLHQTHVYFISPLSEDFLNTLNISGLENISDLQRLISHTSSCVFLPDAHRFI
ncbi:MAG: hypothetical protein Q4C96_03950 [Planctomycetia bacterium]|nr:hypothetical protein [Planctomycetia bacterium]